MSFRIEGQDAQLQVRIENDTRSGQQIIDTIYACKAASWWSCPCGECSKIERCESHQESEVVVLTMSPRAGETLSPKGVTECLGYVLGVETKVAAH